MTGEAISLFDAGVANDASLIEGQIGLYLEGTNLQPHYNAISGSGESPVQFLTARVGTETYVIGRQKKRENVVLGDGTSVTMKEREFFYNPQDLTEANISLLTGIKKATASNVAALKITPPPIHACVGIDASSENYVNELLDWAAGLYAKLTSSSLESTRFSGSEAEHIVKINIEGYITNETKFDPKEVAQAYNLTPGTDDYTKTEIEFNMTGKNTNYKIEKDAKYTVKDNGMFSADTFTEASDKEKITFYSEDGEVIGGASRANDSADWGGIYLKDDAGDFKNYNATNFPNAFIDDPLAQGGDTLIAWTKRVRGSYEKGSGGDSNASTVSVADLNDLYDKLNAAMKAAKTGGAISKIDRDVLTDGIGFVDADYQSLETMFKSYNKLRIAAEKFYKDNDWATSAKKKSKEYNKFQGNTANGLKPIEDLMSQCYHDKKGMDYNVGKLFDAVANKIGTDNTSSNIAGINAHIKDNILGGKEHIKLVAEGSGYKFEAPKGNFMAKLKVINAFVKDRTHGYATNLDFKNMGKPIDKLFNGQNLNLDLEKLSDENKEKDPVPLIDNSRSIA